MNGDRLTRTGEVMGLCEKVSRPICSHRLDAPELCSRVASPGHGALYGISQQVDVGGRLAVERGEVGEEDLAVERHR